MAINMIVTLIAWYCCYFHHHAINAQSFSVMFRGTKIPTSSNSSSSSYGTAFVQHSISSSENGSRQSRISISQSFLNTLRRYMEWIISYFTLANDSFHEKSADSQGGNSRPNFRYDHNQPTYGTSSTIMYLDTSSQPSGQPTTQPSIEPSGQPSNQPSQQPTTIPTRLPSLRPSVQPSNRPSSQPLGYPTQQPSQQPTQQPTQRPSTEPSRQPSRQPTRQPSSQPSMEPTKQPSSGTVPFTHSLIHYISSLIFTFCSYTLLYTTN